MALIHDAPRFDPPRAGDDPAHHVCAVAIASGVALMFAAVPVAVWLVDQAFAFGH